jgi:translation initiation factor IF-2
MMSKTIYVQSPVIVKQLAQQMGVSPYRLIHDLMNMSVFVRVDRSIKPEVATFICKQHGFAFVITDPGEPWSPPAR